MRGAIIPLPNTPSWRGVQLKHRDNFTLCVHPYQESKPDRPVQSTLPTEPLGLILQIGTETKQNTRDSSSSISVPELKTRNGFVSYRGVNLRGERRNLEAEMCKILFKILTYSHVTLQGQFAYK